MLTIQVPNSKVGLGNHKDVRMLRVNSITIGALVQRNHRSKLYCFEHRSIYIAIVYTYIYIYIMANMFNIYFCKGWVGRSRAYDITGMYSQGANQNNLYSHSHHCTTYTEGLGWTCRKEVLDLGGDFNMRNKIRPKYIY